MAPIVCVERSKTHPNSKAKQNSFLYFRLRNIFYFILFFTHSDTTFVSGNVALLGWPVGAAEIVFFFLGENHKRSQQNHKKSCDYL